MSRILAAMASRIPAVDCCPHADLEPDIDIQGKVQAAVEEIDAGHVSTARQILVALLSALDKEVA